MKRNELNTKIMRISKRPEHPLRIAIDGRNLEEVDNSRYLGSLLTNGGSCSKEKNTRNVMCKPDKKEKNVF